MTKEKAEAGFLFLYRLYWLYWCYGVFISALMSSSGVVIGAMPYFSTRRFRILGDKNAGREGPRRMFLIPRCRSVNKMQTAFCSYHERTKESGSSFTVHPNASASLINAHILFKMPIHEG